MPLRPVVSLKYLCSKMMAIPAMTGGVAHPVYHGRHCHCVELGYFKPRMIENWRYGPALLSEFVRSTQR